MMMAPGRHSESTGSADDPGAFLEEPTHGRTRLQEIIEIPGKLEVLLVEHVFDGQIDLCFPGVLELVPMGQINRGVARNKGD